MDDLSSKILRTESLREIESLLEESIAGIEFIGEVDINEEAFGKIGAELRRNLSKTQLVQRVCSTFSSLHS